MVQITPTGMRNEYWRRRLLCGLMVPERYARVIVSDEMQSHPHGQEALARLLTGPAQLDPVVNAEGDCDWLRVVVAGESFDLLVSCFAQGEGRRRGSDDPSDDDLTTRIYSCMLTEEYSESRSSPE
ncbi:hypothetical protein GETHLI_32610 [Geothrix limicola]|uniref:Uncharacterized protein n=1 Tax=Geothrix limicola TaxID=2927978 RepID=A0ABQ5QLH1_9BACT|nr:hypothetical protein [Geothrix limicola]GLH74759.1 hypothetical protein GETHLI_32610 [Geothrix limicola]